MKKEESNYEAKGGYCKVCTGILAGGACMISEIHEKLLADFIHSEFISKKEVENKRTQLYACGGGLTYAEGLKREGAYQVLSDLLTP
mgnify:FL=1